MSQSPQKASPLRLIWVAMLIGQLMFLGVAIFLRQSGAMTSPAADGEPTASSSSTMLVGVGVAMLALCVAISFALPMIWMGADRDGKHSKQAADTRAIVRMALLEGPAMFGIVVYLITGSVGGLAIAGVAVAFYVATTFPPRDQPSA